MRVVKTVDVAPDSRGDWSSILRAAIEESTELGLHLHSVYLEGAANHGGNADSRATRISMVFEAS